MRWWEDMEVRGADDAPGLGIGAGKNLGAETSVCGREAAVLTRSALAAGLVVGGVFILSFFLFFLFATKIWLR